MLSAARCISNSLALDRCLLHGYPCGQNTTDVHQACAQVRAVWVSPLLSACRLSCVMVLMEDARQLLCSVRQLQCEHLALCVHWYQL
jgi:hypothetical protein